MARFDWLPFLKQHNIEFVTSGPNFARSNAANIRCPFCGEGDPSQHMGLSNKGWWGCLRNSSHRGGSPPWLIQRLLGCSIQEARRIAGVADKLAPTHDDFAKSFAALKASAGVAEPSRNREVLSLPREFKPLLNGSPFAEPFLEYLRQRGYRAAQVQWLAKNYNLHYATKGLYAYRIIIPIYDRYGELLSWTARSIVGDVQPRYRTLWMEAPAEWPDAPVAKLAANNTILGLPVLWGADNPRVLVIAEGPFDALKVTAFGHTIGFYAAALFGLNVYPSQMAEIQELSRRFPKIYLLLDEDATLQRLRLLNQLSGINCQALRMPPGSDDPGALPGAEIVKMALDLVSA